MGETLPQIPIAKPLLGEAEVDAAARTIRSGWLTQGPEVAAFEREFAAWVGAEHACAVSNCTTALHLALLAAGVGPGDEVITVSHSFIATANAIRYCGAVPVFVDIEPSTFNIAPDQVERALGPRTRAILAVHQMGMPCDMASLAHIAAAWGIPLIEDAACAAGSEILWNGAWEKVGRAHGDIACFSFHPRKVMTTGDGGMITTRRAEWDRQFRLWRQHGMSVPDTARHNSRQVIFESYEELGYNYRMTDLQAAVGREQLKRLSSVVERRREIAARYTARLSQSSVLEPPAEPRWARSNWQSYCVTLAPGLDQREVMQQMLDAGVSTRRGIMCSHREPAFTRQPWASVPSVAGDPRPLRASEAAQDRSILLPLYFQMTDDEQDRVLETLERAVSMVAVR
jgi:dTDP-4-amino-4,6-dideoxygalactose transaminase